MGDGGHPFSADTGLDLIVAIARFSGIAYPIAICLTLQSIPRILAAMDKVSLSFDLGTVIFVFNAVLAVVSLALMMILYTVLLPNTNLILQPRRDAAGKPLFDD